MQDNDYCPHRPASIKALQHCSNNKKVYLCMMKAHLTSKRLWVQYMSIWMNEQGLEEICEPGGKQASGESSDICDSISKYPILEAAASASAVHLRMKVNVRFFILFHTISYYFIPFH